MRFVGLDQNGRVNMARSIHELHLHIMKNIQGVFSEQDMAVLKEEIEKLEPGDVYVEIGVDEGRSFRAAFEYAKKGVYLIGIDVHDVVPHKQSVGRAPFMEKEKIVGLGKRGFYIHGDADELANIFPHSVDLLFVDGNHDYDSIKKNTEMWEYKVRMGGTILYHDYDHPAAKKWLDEHYEDDKEILHDKIVRVRK
jgi:hypothetical protein